MRQSHYLKHNKGTELPNAAIWVDTETNARIVSKGLETHHLNFGWACYSRTRALDDWLEPLWFRFESPGEFWDWVESLLRPRTRTYLFAHNWNFDAPVLDLFNELPRRGWKGSQGVIDGPPVILKYRRDSMTLTVLDTVNWWRMPLSSIGDSLGLVKLTMPNNSLSRAEWDTYCRRDVEIIYRVMREWWRFLRVNDLGSFAPTLASQSLRAFRHRFMDHEILIDSHQKALPLARESYMGGRVECFRIGRVNGPVTVLDVNSMYPAVMRDHVYPAKLLFHTDKFNLKELSQWLESRCVVARVRLQTSNASYAHYHDGRLTFPTGRFHAVLTTPDLQTAIAQGFIHSVIEAAVYTAEPIFSRFVSQCYRLRLEAESRGDAVSKWLIKILMNSLYGKFGQRGIVWDTVRQTDDLEAKTWEDYDYETGALRTLRQFGGMVQTRSKEPESFDSFPAIAAHVTAHARSLLESYITLACRSNVLYVDTDSLYVINDGAARLAGVTDPKALGRLKLEGVHEWIHINGPKDYETPDKRVIKGIRSNASVLGPGHFAQDQFSSLKGLLNLGDITAPRIKRIEKRLARVYRKGTVRRDGSVTPLNLNEWDPGKRRW